jgi:septum site-determining protein MinC
MGHLPIRRMVEMEMKGIKDGILISLETQEWSQALKDLVGHIDESQAFFEGARLFIDVGDMILRAKEMGELRDILSKHGVLLSGMLSNSLVTQETAQLLGLTTSLKKPEHKTENNMKSLDTLLQGESAVMIRRTMRSGFKVAYQGHVVVLGDVNPGAEIVASGSIVVWGRLRGTAHAGAEGDEGAVVCALDLSPTQLRIAAKAATTPQDQEQPQPEIASIKENQIIAEPWQH